MKIAVPCAQGALCMHFGHCEQFMLAEIDEAAKQIVSTEMVTPPPHEPGVLPKWLAGKQATTIIAGGMGSRAQMLFAEQGIAVVTGAPAGDPKAVIQAYLDNSLVTGENGCDH